VATEKSIVTMWTSKGGTERLCLPSSEEEKWSICSCLLHSIRFYKNRTVLLIGGCPLFFASIADKEKTVSLPLSFPLLGS